MNQSAPGQLPRRSQDFLGRALLTILLLAMAGTLAELLLLEHYDDWQQWIPLALLLLSALAIVWQLARPSAASTRAVWWLMIGLILAGVAGVILHLQGNLEFELELNPGESGFALWFEVFRGATPALAPGSLIPFGLLGLLYASAKDQLLPKDS